MIKLNPFAISALIITITYLPLFIFIVIKGRTLTARIYSLHIFSVFLWGAASFLGTTTSDKALADFTWKFAYSGVLFIPIFFYHAVLLITQKKLKLLLALMYLQAIYFTFQIFWGDMMHVTYMFNSFYYSTSTTMRYVMSAMFWATICCAAHVQLIYYYKKCYPEQKGQILALILAATGFLGGATNYLPNFGVDIYPLGNFIVPVHSLIVTYAILKHQLLDIKIAIKKSIVYSILLLIISLLYLTGVLLFEKFLQGVIGYQSLSISLFTAFLVGILFFPLRNEIQKVVDKIIFNKTQAEIIKENDLLLHEITQTERMRSVATLASGMAHEIKNPLTPIRTFLEYLPQKSNDKEFLKKFGQLAQTSADRIDELINELLRFAKPTSLQLMDIDINKLITSTLDLLSSEFLKFHIRVVKNLEKPTLIIGIDQNQVRQALLNLFLNAIDAMPNGGALTIQTASTEKTCRISIQDTGQGIAKQDLLYIFDPFFTKKDKGTGLGLSITSGIIAKHGGTIKAVSEPGQGATFIIELPITSTTS